MIIHFCLPFVHQRLVITLRSESAEAIDDNEMLAEQVVKLLIAELLYVYPSTVACVVSVVASSADMLVEMVAPTG